MIRWRPTPWYVSRTGTSTKAKASKALAEMGLSVSDAIRLLMFHVAEEQRLPFDVEVPNAETRRVMRELDKGKGKRFKTAEDLFKDLGI
jgi:DNA-damage-inducible protein J